MNYHRRFSEDGACEIICIGCFETIGIAKSGAAAKEIEAQHVCGKKPILTIPANSGPATALKFIEPVARIPAIARGLHLLGTLLAAGLFLYALPTELEWVASHHVNSWFAIILPGDLTGCVCLAVAFRMRRTGVLLYVLLTACEAFLYSARVVSADALLWVVDLVPTLVVACAIALRAIATPPKTTLA